MWKFCVLILICLLNSSCAIIHIEHTWGERPKIRIDTGLDDCKIRTRALDTVSFVCKREGYWFQ